MRPPFPSASRDWQKPVRFGAIWCKKQLHCPTKRLTAQGECDGSRHARRSAQERAAPTGFQRTSLILKCNISGKDCKKFCPRNTRINADEECLSSNRAMKLERRKCVPGQIHFCCANLILRRRGAMADRLTFPTGGGEGESSSAPIGNESRCTVIPSSPGNLTSSSAGDPVGYHHDALWRLF